MIDRLLAARWPKEPINRFVGPMSRFFHIQSAGGVVPLICAATAVTLRIRPGPPTIRPCGKRRSAFAGADSNFSTR